jgi:hypothetical protein
LVADRSELDPNLATNVETWTQGVSDARKIVEILHEKVANEVRYTGLEFGMAGFQPQQCRDVWQHRYGDCKDKANLLRAMLAHKGIHAEVVLVHAGNDGRIQMASPSWAQFNHAIVLVEGIEAGPFFCDPTVKYLPAGRLAPEDCNRDALVVRHDRGEWVHIPDLIDAAFRVRCEMTMAPTGELSGWFTLVAEGSDASAYAQMIGDRDHDDRVRALRRYAEEFFPGAEIVDHEMVPPAGSLGTFQIRMYCIRPARSASGQSLRFPFPTAWLPKTETVGERQFPFLTPRHEESLDLTLKLPAGWAPQFIPAPFAAASADASFSAQWEPKDGELRAHLDWRTKHAEIAAKDYATFQQAARALIAWLDQPIVLVPSAEKKSGVVAEQRETDLSDFPMLSNGRSQLGLVERKYPMGVADGKRRAALEQTLQWFPDDASTVFQAQLQLAILDDEKTPAKLADEASGLLQRYAPQLSADTLFWAEWVEADARWRATKSPADLRVLEQLAENPSMAIAQRARMALMISANLMSTDPKAAAKFLQPFTDVESELQGKLVDLFLVLLVQNGDCERLAPWLKDFSADMVRQRMPCSQRLWMQPRASGLGSLPRSGRGYCRC